MRILLLAAAAPLLNASSFRSSYTIDRQNARSLLEARRQSRANTDLFEEIQKGNRERECNEEKCDFEEVRETYENEADAQNWWADAVRRCTNAAAEEQCDAKNTKKCINQWKKMVCVCKDGWQGDLCKDDKDECENAETRLSCGAKACVNTVGSYKCGCEDGFTMQADQSCLDNDECAVDNGGCEMGCDNTPGGFQCGCDAGYALNADGKTCSDVDECADPTSCGANSKCQNNEGAFECICDAGYTHGFGDTQNDHACEDINECEDPSYECPDKSECQNSLGSYTCDCADGFMYNILTRECDDIDECLVTNGGCDQICSNMEGSFECSCADGYRYPTDGRSDNTNLGCENVDECAEGTHTCGVTQTCEDTDGSFLCTCKDGYAGEDCADVNECLASPCPAGQNCQNTDGSFMCTSCPTGLERSADGDCVDADECAIANGGCQHNCHNSDGSYSCSCNAGYELMANGLTCGDTDECSGTVCQSEGNIGCLNTDGGYECTCASGFNRNADKKTCSDVDECTNGASCPEGQECSNIPGGFTCVDLVVSGCAGDNKCDHACTPKEGGGIECSCWPGYVLSCDDHTCLADNDEDAEIPVPEQGDCPAGFYQLGGKYDKRSSSGCFFVSIQKADQEYAAKACEGLGASLAKVENKEQNFYLSTLFGTENQFWIGAKYTEADDDFYWPDNTDIQFSRWAEGEPSTALALEEAQEPEHCVVSNWGYPGNWNDLPCMYNEAFYACSRDHSGGSSSNNAVAPVTSVVDANDFIDPTEAPETEAPATEPEQPVTEPDEYEGDDQDYEEDYDDGEDDYGDDEEYDDYYDSDMGDYGGARRSS